MSEELLSELVYCGEAFLGRAAEPIVQIVPYLVVLVHPVYAYGRAIHAPIIAAGQPGR
jgi:hypothetical protein